MEGFFIGHVEKIVGLKAHILRYWEEVIPSIAPAKNVGGRKAYSRHNIATFLKLKYLIYEKKYTIEGARDRLIEESCSTDVQLRNFMYAVDEMRWQLFDLYDLIKTRHKVDE